MAFVEHCVYIIIVVDVCQLKHVENVSLNCRKCTGQVIKLIVYRFSTVFIGY